MAKLMKRQLIHFTETHENEVHFVIGNHDLSICGFDLAGDEGYETAVDTKKPVNCPDCLEIVSECKWIRLKKAER